MPRRSADRQGRILLSRVRLDPANEALHPEEEIAMLVFLLETYGQQKPILLDGDDVCVCGEGLVTAARRLKWKFIEYERTDLKGEMRAAYRYADNQLGTHSYLDLGLAGATARTVADELGDGFDPLMLGLAPAEYRALVSAAAPPSTPGGGGDGARVIRVEGVRWSDREVVMARVGRALEGTGYEAQSY